MSSFEAHYDALRERINTRLDEVIDRSKPETMYPPARYVLTAGGKRIRPVLVMLACEAAGGNADDALDAAVAVEILHTFTLVHDDIMDHADQRRGRDTVHKKWDENVAILVGDNMIGLAYNTLLRSMKGDIREIVRVFTDGMIEVCEGQAYDKEFESLPAVTLDEYFMMIGKKTGKLVSISAEIGALIAGANEARKQALLEYAYHIGRAFQVHDDLLDVIADQKKLGKPIGGDILEGKKTYLLVTALERATGEDKELLTQVATRKATGADMVERVSAIYESLGVLDAAREEIRTGTDAALGALEGLEEGTARETLYWFAEMLLARMK